MLVYRIIAALDTTSLPKPDTTKTGPTIMNIVFGAAGAICLLIIVMAGLRYTMSQDNPQETARAKNQIIYALVGLVVVLTAASIINFVLKSVVGA